MSKENLRPDLEWLKDAACKPEDQDLFFSTVLTPQQIAARKALCDGCPVKAECLDNAMFYGDVGVYRAGKYPKQLEKELSARGGPKKEKSRKRLT